MSVVQDRRSSPGRDESVLPLLFARREYISFPALAGRLTTSVVISGTTSGLDRGPDDGDW